MMNRSSILLAVIVMALFSIPAFAADEKKGPKITNKVFFDISIDGKESGMSSMKSATPVISSDHVRWSLLLEFVRVASHIVH